MSHQKGDKIGPADIKSLSRNGRSIDGTIETANTAVHSQRDTACLIRGKGGMPVLSGVSKKSVNVNPSFFVVYGRERRGAEPAPLGPSASRTRDAWKVLPGWSFGSTD
jgi:hypothetical protein